MFYPLILFKRESGILYTQLLVTCLSTYTELFADKIIRTVRFALYSHKYKLKHNHIKDDVKN